VIADPPRAEVHGRLSYDDLLLHYATGAQHSVQSVDQLGNFLMGFGVLSLGYLLQADVAPLGRAVAAGDPGSPSALAALGAWGVAVGLLVLFVLTYVFRVLAGRAVHAREGIEDGVGDVIDLPEDLRWDAFVRGQRSFPQFLKASFRAQDLRDPAALFYARWTYLRFMTLRKLVEMQRMRRLLGLALLFGILFQLLAVYQRALVG